VIGEFNPPCPGVDPGFFQRGVASIKQYAKNLKGSSFIYLFIYLFYFCDGKAIDTRSQTSLETSQRGVGGWQSP